MLSDPVSLILLALLSVSCLAIASVFVLRVPAARYFLLGLGLLVGTSHGFITRSIPALDDPLRLLEDGSFMALAIAGVLRIKSLRGIDLLFGVLLISPLLWFFSSELASGDAMIGYRLTGMYMALYFAGRFLRWRPTLTLKVIGLALAPSILLGVRQAFFGLSTAEAIQVRSSLATFDVLGANRLIGGASTGQEFSFQLVLAGAVLAGALVRLDRRLLPEGNALRKRRTVALAGACLAIVAAVQVLALQRSSLVGLGAALTAAFLVASRGRWLRTTVIGVGSVLIFSAILLQVANSTGVRGEAALTRLFSVVDPASDGSFNERVDHVWPRAVDAIAKRPFTGWGPGSAGAPTLTAGSRAPLGPMFTDNLLLHVGVQYGILYTAALAVGFGAALLQVVRGGRDCPLANAGLFAIAGLCAAGLTGSFLSIVDVSGVMLLLFGHSISALHEERTRAAFSSDLQVRPA